SGAWHRSASNGRAVWVAAQRCRHHHRRRARVAEAAQSDENAFRASISHGRPERVSKVISWPRVRAASGSAFFGAFEVGAAAQLDLLELAVPGSAAEEAQ